MDLSHTDYLSKIVEMLNEHSAIRMRTLNLALRTFMSMAFCSDIIMRRCQPLVSELFEKLLRKARRACRS